MTPKPREPDRPEPFQPPLVSAAIAAGYGGSTYWLATSAAAYHELLPLLGFYTGYQAGRYAIKTVTDHHKLLGHRRKIKAFEELAEEHGGAGMASVDDIEQSDYLSWEQGVYIGQVADRRGRRRDLFAAGNYHISVVAPPGQLKTMAVVVPSLLRWRWSQGNLLVNDPSGEILSICRGYLESIGYKVVVITPFADEINRLIKPKPGEEVIDAGLDFLSALRGRDLLPSMVRDELMRAMAWLCREKADASEESRFFVRAARLLAVFLAMHDLAEGRHPTLVSMRTTLMLGIEGLKALFHEAADRTDVFEGVYAETALSLMSLIDTAGPQFAGGYGVCEQALEKYDHFSSLGEHVAGATHDPTDFSDPDKRVAYFVAYPPAKMKPFGEPMALTISYLLDTIASVNSPVATTAFIDEVGALSLGPGLADSMNFYRKMADLRLVLIWQDLKGQALQTYGKAVVNQILSASLMKLFLGIVDPETLQLASSLTGKRAMIDFSLTDHQGDPSNLVHVGQTRNQKSRSTMEADEVRRMPSDKLLCVVGNVRAIEAYKTAYWDQPELAKRAGRSPYHRG